MVKKGEQELEDKLTQINENWIKRHAKKGRRQQKYGERMFRSTKIHAVAKKKGKVNDTTKKEIGKNSSRSSITSDERKKIHNFSSIIVGI